MNLYLSHLQSEMQTALSSIWTCFAKFIFYNTTQYVTSTSILDHDIADMLFYWIASVSLHSNISFQLSISVLGLFSVTYFYEQIA